MRASAPCRTDAVFCATRALCLFRQCKKRSETRMRILIAEIAPGARRRLCAAPPAGAAVDHVASGSEADAALMTNNEFDLLRPGPAPAQAAWTRGAQGMRARGSSIPVLILTAADSVERARQGTGLRRRRLHGQAFSRCRSSKPGCARSRAAAWAAAPTPSNTARSEYDQAGRVATIDSKMVELSGPRAELGLLEILAAARRPPR